MRIAFSGIVGVAAAVGGAAHAALMPVSYTMYNGTSGSFVYRDETYAVGGNPHPNATVNYALLSGGLGDLTDGLGKTTNDWQSSTLADPWVGWYAPSFGSQDIEITFDFGSQVQLQEATIWSLNGGLIGGVGYSAIYIFSQATWEYSSNGSSWTSWGVAQATPAQLAFAGVSAIPLGAGSVNARYARVTMQTVNPGAWIFISEIEFNGDSGNPIIPLPHAGGMAVAGLAILALRRRRCVIR